MSDKPRRQRPQAVPEKRTRPRPVAEAPKRARPRPEAAPKKVRARPGVQKGPKYPDWYTEDMPYPWPNGSALMMAPHYKQHVNYAHVMGGPDEGNPNLVGRIVRQHDGTCRVWRWNKKSRRYTELSTQTTHSGAMTALMSIYKSRG